MLMYYWAEEHTYLGANAQPVDASLAEDILSGSLQTKNPTFWCPICEKRYRNHWEPGWVMFEDKVYLVDKIVVPHRKCEKASDEMTWAKYYDAQGNLILDALLA